jgi:spore maturation protein SpmA
MNAIFLAIVCLAFGVAAVRQLAAGTADPEIMSLVAKAIVEDAGRAVTLAIGLVGVMICS